MSYPTFIWGILTDPVFATLLDTTYAEVVHWRRNCFQSLLARLAESLKAATVLPILLLQTKQKIKDQ